MRKPCKPLFILISCLLSNITFAGQDALLEPPDGRVIHGLGQYLPAPANGGYTDDENTQLVENYISATKSRPLVYSIYVSIDPNDSVLNLPDVPTLHKKFDPPFILLIGLALFDISAYLGDRIKQVPSEKILNGDWDQKIIRLAREIKQTGAPGFIRPGWEFGDGNRGFHDCEDFSASAFKKIWIYLHSVFKAENVTNIAWVWNTYDPASFPFMQWYPGDEYVDWWGINYFFSGNFNSGNSFLDSALQHRKPVFICEACPAENSVESSDTWTRWFEPFFKVISNHQQIKAFTYINSPWDRPNEFESWKDSRMNLTTTSKSVLDLYTEELKKKKYIHMSEYIADPLLLKGTASTINQKTHLRPPSGNQVNGSIDLRGVKTDKSKSSPKVLLVKKNSTVKLP